jgi:hypothetical protein
MQFIGEWGKCQALPQRKDVRVSQSGYTGSEGLFAGNECFDVVSHGTCLPSP